jgi:hypothetical protein
LFLIFILKTYLHFSHVNSFFLLKYTNHLKILYFEISLNSVINYLKWTWSKFDFKSMCWLPLQNWLWNPFSRV